MTDLQISEEVSQAVRLWLSAPHATRGSLEELVQSCVNAQQQHTVETLTDGLSELSIARNSQLGSLAQQVIDELSTAKFLNDQLYSANAQLTARITELEAEEPIP
jgi:hypothetical protein